MSKKIITISAIIILIFLSIGVFVTFSNNNSPKTSNNSVMIEDDDENKNMEDSGVVMQESRYVQYSSEKFNSYSDKKRVYFFHAAWCPTCKVANEEFNADSNLIPEDVVLFKTDYDSEQALKKKFGITYQHTFVYVNEKGDEITKWNGGGVAELIENTR